MSEELTDGGGPASDVTGSRFPGSTPESGMQYCPGRDRLGVTFGETMTSFDARLRLLNQPGLPLLVEVDLTGERMVVTTSGRELADWSLDEIEVLSRSDGFHIQAEGEEVVLNVMDGIRFARELGIGI